MPLLVALQTIIIFMVHADFFFPSYFYKYDTSFSYYSLYLSNLSCFSPLHKLNMGKNSISICTIPCESISLHFDNGPLFSCGTENNPEFDKN